MKKTIIGFCAFFCLSICGCYSSASGFTPPDTASEVSMKAAPSVIAEATALNEAENMLEFADVILFDFEFADFSVASAYDLCKEAVPAVRLRTESGARKVTAFLKESEAQDVFVVSESAELIDSVRAEYAAVRGVYDARAYELGGQDGYALAGKACAAGAQIVLLGKNASREIIEKIQARAILVWVQTSADQMSVCAAAASGCYGIVTDNAKEAKSALLMFCAETVIRPTYIAGHRGCPRKYNENSAEGVEAALKAGATHAEIDVHLSADGELVIMHDPTLDRTTNGTGRIRDLTLAEIRRYNIVDNVMLAGVSQIPILADMFEIIRKPEFVDKLLIIELKANDTSLVSALKSEIAKYPELRDRLMFITFYESLLSLLCEQMPDIPRGYLDSLSKTDFLRRMSPHNAFIDNIVAAELISVESARYLRDYGYAAWSWTYNDGGSLSSAVGAGYAGVTANNPEDGGGYIYKICAPSALTATKAKSAIETDAILFDGSVRKAEGEWLPLSATAGLIKVEYADEENFQTLAYYSELVILQEEKGCAGFIFAESSICAAVSLCACACIAIRRRKA